MKFDIEKAIKKIKKPWTPVDLAKFDDKVLRIALCPQTFLRFNDRSEISTTPSPGCFKNPSVL